MTMPKKAKLPVTLALACAGAYAVVAAVSFDATAADDKSLTQLAAAKCSVPAASAAEPSPDELASAYSCIKSTLLAGYKKSGNEFAAAYQDWKLFNTKPYRSETHGRRFANNYGNKKSEAVYSKYEDGGRMPVGAVLAKDTFTVNKKGAVGVGPFFIMEKMPAGWHKESDDWRYTLMLPNGKIFGETKGTNSNKVKFCINCHIAVAEDQDSLFYLPEELRVN